MATPPSSDQLAQILFADPRRAERIMCELAGSPPAESFFHFEPYLVAALANAPDPDRALLNFTRFTAARPDIVSLYRFFTFDPALLDALIRVLGYSQLLADVLVRSPDYVELLRRGAFRVASREALGAELSGMIAVLSSWEGRLNALRRFRRRELLRIAGADILGHAGFEDAVMQMSNMADACLHAALELCRARAEEEYGVPYDENGWPITFSVLALDRLGGAELDYSGHISLMFVCSDHGQTEGGRPLPAAEYFDRLAQSFLDALSQPLEEGVVFQVHVPLQPEGRLVPTLAEATNYYESFGEPAERQALIKARHAAGDAELAQRFVQRVTSFVYGKRTSPEDIRVIQAGRERAEQQTKDRGVWEVDVREGRGGLREVESAVQLLQLVVGAERPEVRRANTLEAIESLLSAGALSGREAVGLRRGYVFLRQVEHALQIMTELPQSLLPGDSQARGALAKCLGFSSAAGFEQEYRAVTDEVRGLFEVLFYGPVRPPAGGGAESALQRLVLERPNSEQPALRALAGLGFADQFRAVQTLRRMALDEGLGPPSTGERLAAIIDQVADAAARSGDPDRVLANFERFARLIGARRSFYWFLSDYPHNIDLLAQLAGKSQFLSDALAVRPELFDALLEPGVVDAAKSASEQMDELQSRLRHETTHMGRMHALRLYRTREIVRIGMRDVSGAQAVEGVLREISELAEACVGAALSAALDEVGKAHCPLLAILGLGDLAGWELDYTSRLDILMVADEADLPEATDVAGRLVQYLTRRTRDGVVFEVNPYMMPGSQEGPVWTVANLREYCGSQTGLAERLMVARSRAVAGCRATGEAALQALHGLAYGGPVLAQELAETVALRRSAGRATQTNQHSAINLRDDPGGIADLALLVTGLQLHFAQDAPTLRTPHTAEALRTLMEVGGLSREVGERLLEAWLRLRTVHTRLQIIEERPMDALPTDALRLGRIARRLPSVVGDTTLSGVELLPWVREAMAAVSETVELLHGGFEALG